MNDLMQNFGDVPPIAKKGRIYTDISYWYTQRVAMRAADQRRMW
jgi:hypothetical protein